jgi:hypothetical protein
MLAIAGIGVLELRAFVGDVLVDVFNRALSMPAGKMQILTCSGGVTFDGVLCA